MLRALAPRDTRLLLNCVYISLAQSRSSGWCLSHARSFDLLLFYSTQSWMEQPRSISFLSRSPLHGSPKSFIESSDRLCVLFSLYLLIVTSTVFQLLRPPFLSAVCLLVRNTVSWFFVVPVCPWRCPPEVLLLLLFTLQLGLLLPFCLAALFLRCFSSQLLLLCQQLLSVPSSPFFTFHNPFCRSLFVFSKSLFHSLALLTQQIHIERGFHFIQ